MKKSMLFGVTLSALMTTSLVYGFTVNEFLAKYPQPFYQDLIVNNSEIVIGTDICSQRYDIIKNILINEEHPKSILDIGACFGYFSLKLAEDFPTAQCVMVQPDNNNFYKNHEGALRDICVLNSHLKNITYLDKKLTIQDLEKLNSLEYFDVVLAFLVIHKMGENLEQQIKFLELIRNLGKTVIIEVSDNVAPELADYLRFLNTEGECSYICSIKRRHNPKEIGMGHFYVFSNKTDKDRQVTTRIKKETFKMLNGVYP